MLAEPDVLGRGRVRGSSAAGTDQRSRLRLIHKRAYHNQSASAHNNSTTGWDTRIPWDRRGQNMETYAAEGVKGKSCGIPMWIQWGSSSAFLGSGPSGLNSPCRFNSCLRHLWERT